MGLGPVLGWVGVSLSGEVTNGIMGNGHTEFFLAVSKYLSTASKVHHVVIHYSPFNTLTGHDWKHYSHKTSFSWKGCNLDFKHDLVVKNWNVSVSINELNDLWPSRNIGYANLKCASWTFKKKLALKMRARCKNSIVLVLTSLYTVHFGIGCHLKRNVLLFQVFL